MWLHRFHVSRPVPLSVYWIRYWGGGEGLYDATSCLLAGCMFHLGGLCSGGLCPGGLCPGGSLSSGSLSRGISVQGDLWKETPQTEIPSPSWWMSGQYVSYWNAVWFILSFYPQKKDKIMFKQ